MEAVYNKTKLVCLLRCTERYEYLKETDGKTNVNLWNRWRRIYNIKEVDLSGRNYSDSLDLAGINFENVNLENTDFNYVFLVEANLRNANLKNANFEGAFLGQADLRGANLENVNFDKADFWETKF